MEESSLDLGDRNFKDEDLEWCYDTVQDVSRTFAITVDLLDEPMSSYICVGYLLCRIADTVEDAGHIPPEEQAEILDRYNDVLEGADPEEFEEEVEKWIPDGNDDDWKLVGNASRVVGVFRSFSPESRRAILPPVQELVGGMSEFVERYSSKGGLRIHSVEELEEYCWYVAGTVGDLITNLVVRGASKSKTKVDVLRQNSRSFGLLLQLVNVAKDVRKDYEEENNVYLPAEWLEEEGVGQEEVADEENADAVARVVRRVVDRAEGYLDDSQTYLEEVPEKDGNNLEAWAVPFLLAVATLRELRSRPSDVVLEGDVKISRREVMAIIDAFTSPDSDVGKESVGDLRKTVSRKPFHRS
ncbi:MAG: phytoene/squalene synthase family protein [Halobacteria archaeon]|nr:phytoene/squalene synthase family protein [Halobacteria archaeon]